MRLVLRVVLWLVGLALLAVIVAALVLPFYFDPNDYKGELERVVRQETGRPLAIEGNIKLSFFPWLGVEMGHVALGNAPGFGTGSFASIEQVDLRVKLLPLLRKRVEMDTVTLRGLTLNLIRSKDGQGNWEDLARRRGAGKPTTEQPPARTAGTPLGGLAIGGVDVRGAHIDWDDRQTGQHYTVDRLSLATGAIVPGKPVTVDLDFHLEGGEPVMAAEVAVQGELDADPAVQIYRLHGLKISAKLSGAPIPHGTQSLSVVADVDADLARQTVSVANLRVETLGLATTGTLSAEGVLGQPRFQGSLAVAPFNGRDVLARLGQAPPPTADSKALTHIALNAQLAGSASAVTLAPLTVQLDDSTLAGKVEVADFKGPALRFDLTLDALDLDRYLPPPAAPQAQGAAPAEQPAAPAAAAAGGAAAALPVEALRRLDANGELRLGSLKVANLSMTDLLMKVSAKDGVVQVNPITSRLYGGSYRGSLALDSRGSELAVTAEESLSGVQAGPLLKDLTHQERLTGTAEVGAQLTMHGNDGAAMVRTLGGSGHFSFANGAVKGVNIGRLIREAKAALKGTTAPPEGGPVETDFTELRGTVQLADGVARNDDLSAKSPLLRVTGEGSVNLVNEQLDYLITAVVVGTAAGQGGRELAELKGVPVPIKVSGSLAQPKLKLDLDKLLKEKGKEVLEKEKAKVQEKVQEKLEKKLGDKAKGLLDGLFR